MRKPNLAHWLKMALKKLGRWLGLVPQPTAPVVVPPAPPVVVEPPAPPPEPEPIPSLPRLVPCRHYFKLETGARFTAIECSDFALLARFQRGEDITPVLQQRAACGFNLLRVWTLMKLAQYGIADLDPDYSVIPAFLDECAKHGLYVELTAYTSWERPDHWQRLIAAVAGKTNVLLELVNEGDLPVNRIDLSRYQRPTGVLASHGSGSSGAIPVQPGWDWTGYHTNGSSEEQRKVAHNGMEDGYNVLHVPTVVNETSRYPEVGMWRGASLERCKQLAFDAAAGAALLCAGATFHSIAGKASLPFDAATEAVARAWTAGARSVPLEAQDGAYVRRDDLLTPDLLRVYERRGAGVSFIVRIRR